MSSPHATIAVVFDFDDTLLPDSTTSLLEAHGMDPKDFWGVKTKELVLSGYDPTLAYLKLILDNVGKGKPFGSLTNKNLRKFGATLEKKFFPGVSTLFGDLKNIVGKFQDIHIEFYIISGGLQEVILGSKLVQKHFSGVYGCKLTGNTEDGPLKYIKRCITFTEKTRFIFEINKGIKQNEAGKHPYLVNKDIPLIDRRIPFQNIIYVGDGLTDIPCFSLLKSLRGTPFGVFKGDSETAKRALLEFLTPGRVISMHTPKYRKSDDLGTLLRAAVANRCSKIELEKGLAESV